MPATKSITAYLEDTPIDGKATGATKIQNAVSTDYLPISAALETVSHSGVVTPPVVSVGTNSPDYDDILPLTTILGTAGTVLNIPIVAGAVYNNVDVYANVGVAGIGLGSITFRVTLVSAHY